MSVQEALLGFAEQELVSHAATVFAALAATFAFARFFRPRTRQYWRADLRLLVYVFILALLLTGTFYMATRFLFWGYFANVIVTTIPDPKRAQSLPKAECPGGNLTLGCYQAMVMENLTSTATADGKWYIMRVWDIDSCELQIRLLLVFITAFTMTWYPVRPIIPYWSKSRVRRLTKVLVPLVVVEIIVLETLLLLLLFGTPILACPHPPPTT